MTLDLESKQHALRLLHHNVAVVSTGQGSDTIGATVTWFTQSSFDPPLVTLAVKADSRLYAGIIANRQLLISLVKQGDKELAGRFFKPGTWEDDTFGGFPAQPYPSGGAILTASPAWLAADVIQVIETGDHHIIIAQIMDAGINEQAAQAMCLSETGWHYGG